MSGLTYNILDYLGWISVGLTLIVVIFVFISTALAISSALRILAMKWRLIVSRRHWHPIGPSG